MERLRWFHLPKGAIWLALGLGLSPCRIAAAGTLVVVGRNYSIFLKFRVVSRVTSGI